MRISTNILLGFLLIAALVGITGYITSERSQAVLQDTIGDDSTKLAVKTIDDIDRTIQHRTELIQLFVTRPLIKTGIIESNKEFEKLDDIQEYINTKDTEWTGTKKEEITPFMQELKTNDLAKHVQTVYDYLNTKYRYPVFSEIFITNKYGAVIAETGKTTDYRQDDEEWWQAAKVLGINVRDIEYDASTEIYSIPISIRINDNQGNFIGIINAVLNIQETLNLIIDMEKEIPKTTLAQFILTNQQGKIIYCSNQEARLFDDITTQIPEYRVHEMSYAQEKLYFVANDEAGNRKLFAHAHSKGYQDYTGHNWSLFIEYDAKTAFMPATKLRNTVMIISGAILLLAIISGIYVSNKIARPIIKLNNNITEITKGNLDIQPGKSTINEIQILTDSFKRILASLKLAVLKVGLKKEEIGLGEAIKAKEEAEAKFKVIFEKAKDAIMTLNRKQFLDGNPATLDIFGLKNIEELRKSHPSDLSPPKQPNGNDSFPEAMKHIETAFKKGTDHFYWIHKRKDGTPFDADVLLSKINEETLQATVRDISLEVSLKNELEKFKFIMENAAEEFYLVLPDGKLEYANKLAAKNLGYTQEELMKKSVKDFDPIWGSKFRMHFTDVKNKKIVSTDTTHITKNKKRIRKQMKSAYAKIGGKEYVAGFGSEITEEEHGGKQYLQFLEKTADAIIIADPETQKIAECNPAAERLTGYSKKELTKMHVQNLHPRDSLKTISETFKKMASGATIAIKTEIITKDKKKIPVEISGSPIKFKGYKMMQGLFLLIKKKE